MLTWTSTVNSNLQSLLLKKGFQIVHHFPKAFWLLGPRGNLRGNLAQYIWVGTGSLGCAPLGQHAPFSFLSLVDQGLLLEKGFQLQELASSAACSHFFALKGLATSTTGVTRRGATYHFSINHVQTSIQFFIWFKENKLKMSEKNTGLSGF